MADLLPSFPDTSDAGGEEPRVVGIDSDDAEDLLSVLSSDTARAILDTLHEEPSTPAGIAEAVDTSIQNAQYHLDNLEEAGVVEVADVAYSEKGREMSVYAPADRALVVVAGQDEETSGLKSALSRLLGGVGVLGLASVVVQRLVTSGALGPRAPRVDSGGVEEEGYDGADAAGDANATTAEEPTVTPEPTATAADDGGMGVMDVETTAQATETVEEAATAEPTTELARTTAEAAGSGLDAGGLDALATAPGTMFFVGGLLVLVALVVLDARR